MMAVDIAAHGAAPDPLLQSSPSNCTTVTWVGAWRSSSAKSTRLNTLSLSRLADVAAALDEQLGQGACVLLLHSVAGAATAKPSRAQTFTEAEDEEAR